MRLYILPALGILAVTPAFPDIINVNINGSVFGGGYLTFFCAFNGCPGGTVDSPPFTLSGTNTKLGVFTVSDSTSAIDPNSGVLSTASGEAAQTSAATGDSFSLNLSTTLSSSGTGAQESFSALIDNSVDLTFTLTAESLMALSENQSNGFGLFGFAGSLHGPTGDLLDLSTSSEPFEGSLTLQPGTYDFLADLQGFPDISVPVGPTNSDEVSVSATFTAIPESRWTWVAPLILLALGGRLFHRRSGRGHQFGLVPGDYSIEARRADHNRI